MSVKRQLFWVSNRQAKIKLNLNRQAFCSGQQSGLSESVCFNCVFLVGICSLSSTEWSSLWCVKAQCLKPWSWTEKSTIPCTGQCNFASVMYSFFIILVVFAKLWCISSCLWFSSSRFLFENQSPAHVYYRWKLYSILQVWFLCCKFHWYSSDIKEKCIMFWDHSPAVLILTVNDLLRVKHQSNGKRRTLGCLRMAPCGVRLLLIHTSMGLMMMARKRRKRRRAARKAVWKKSKTISF